MGNPVADVLKDLVRGRVRAVVEATSPDGTQVRRLERTRAVEWYVNGDLVAEHEAVAVARTMKANLG